FLFSKFCLVVKKRLLPPGSFSLVGCPRLEGYVAYALPSILIPGLGLSVARHSPVHLMREPPPVQSQSTSTSTSLPSTLTGNLRTPEGAGGTVTAPVLTLKCAPCQGHSTVSPFSSPSPSGPPLCVQVLSIA